MPVADTPTPRDYQPQAVLGRLEGRNHNLLADSVMQEKMQLAVVGVVVIALTLAFGMAMVLTSGPPDEGQESQGLGIVPLPPFRSAFDYPNVGLEFGVIEGGVVELPEDEAEDGSGYKITEKYDEDRTITPTMETTDPDGNTMTVVETIEQATDGEEGPTGDVGD